MSAQTKRVGSFSPRLESAHLNCRGGGCYHSRGCQDNHILFSASRSDKYSGFLDLLQFVLKAEPATEPELEHVHSARGTGQGQRKHQRTVLRLNWMSHIGH